MLNSVHIDLTHVITGVLSIIVVFLLFKLKTYRELQHREKLRIIVSYFRLRKMLSFVGIDIDQYINQIPTRDISHHITNCHNCTNISACDKCLNTRHKSVNNINFCPNHKSLIVYIDTLRPPIA